MQLTEGQAAPAFTTTDTSGKTISLEDYKGHYVLLSFFRYAGCPFCNLSLIKLIERYENFSSRGLQTVAFFQSPLESIDKYVLAKHPPFPVIADPNKEVYAKYAIESSVRGGLKSLADTPGVLAAILKGDVVQGTLDGDLFLMPAQFIVRPDGTILKSHYGTDFGDKLPFIEIEEVLLTEIATSNVTP